MLKEDFSIITPLLQGILRSGKIAKVFTILFLTILYACLISFGFLDNRHKSEA